MIKKLKLTKDKNELSNKINIFFSTDTRKGYCCVINANIIVECFKNKTYQAIVKNANFNTCDGINVKRLYNALHKNKIEKYTGPDLFKDIVFEDKNYTHFFLGGQKKVLNGLRNELLNKNKNISEKNFCSPPFLSVDKFDYESIGELINKQTPDFIWIGLGAPKQEIFMSNLLPYIDRGLMVGVGAAFNFYSGISEFKRAPDLMVNLHLEWLFRAFQEPQRIIKRQLKCLCYFPLIYISELFAKNKK